MQYKTTISCLLYSYSYSAGIDFSRQILTSKVDHRAGLSPRDALKHHFTSLKTELISLQQRVSERKFP